jgi:hypothetical protein
MDKKQTKALPTLVRSIKIFSKRDSQPDTLARQVAEVRALREEVKKAELIAMQQGLCRRPIDPKVIDTPAGLKLRT